jgi:hypothetical protein
MEDAMARKNEPNKQPAGSKPEFQSHEDPFHEESTDFRAPGEKFEIMPQGENLDLNRMDQPRTNLKSLPKAHQEKERGNKRAEGVPTRENTPRRKKTA